MRVGFRGALAGTALCALLLTSVAAANVPKALTAFSGTGGSLGEATARGPDNVRYDCYSIEVPAGTEFNVALTSSEFTPEIWIARGAHCTSSALQAQSDRAKTSEGTAQLSFKSAGGRYLIFARADDAAGAGRYRIRVITSGATGLPGGSGQPVLTAAGGDPSSTSTSTPGAGGEVKGEDARLALMRKQVQQRNAELAAEAARKAEEEKQRQIALAKQRERERQEAAARQSSGGNGGIFGGLAMGLGAVLAGGNAETVMGAAMKGVEMTTDDPNVKAALAGQGEAMMASGLGVSQAEITNGLSGGMLGNVTGAALGGGGGGGTWRTQPAFGSSQACSMMNETNYKEVALSGGPDTQLLTLCGAAWNYYWMYHNAKNQGYSATDAEVTYQAHADAARVAIDFYNSSR